MRSIGEITTITKSNFVGSVNRTFTILMHCGGADVLVRVNGGIFFLLSLPAAYKVASHGDLLEYNALKWVFCKVQVDRISEKINYETALPSKEQMTNVCGRR